MTGSWFIDALDSRGGLAVASRRDADLMLNVLKDSGPSVFISPPTFVPEFLDSRAVGFGLARMQAQAGLFHNGAEVSFDSLPAVVEFVRRTYLRGTGGDGPAENGGPPRTPKPIPGDRPVSGGSRERKETVDEAWQPTEKDDPAANLLNFAKFADQASLHLGSGKSGPPHPPGVTPLAGTPSNKAHRLARGGFWVLEELIRRRPDPTSDEFVDWLSAVNRLIGLFFRMGLWSAVATKSQLPSSDLLLEYAEQPSGDDTEGFFRELIAGFVLGKRTWPYWPYLHCCGISDLLDALIALPAPVAMVMFARPDSKNLQALLSGFVASPADLLSISGFDVQIRCAETILFAAAALNLDGETAPSAGNHPSSLFADRLIGRALAWMDGNLPKLVFSTTVEKLILSASNIPA